MRPGRYPVGPNGGLLIKGWQIAEQTPQGDVVRDGWCTDSHKHAPPPSGIETFGAASAPSGRHYHRRPCTRNPVDTTVYAVRED